VHGSVDLGLLALRYTSKTNGVSAHACCHTLLEAAVLAAVAIDTEYGALLVLRAWPVVNSLLNRPAEEALASLAGVNPVVEPRGLVTADTAQNTVVSIKLYEGAARADLLLGLRRQLGELMMATTNFMVPVQ
jgi:metal-dependent amidase/aminoacylase/carboxypeptidase family protein